MIRIAIVEDEKENRRLLREYLDRFAAEKGEKLSVTEFIDGVQIAFDHTGEFDLIFLDIEMPGMNGMDAAEKLREKDENVMLIFVTNMAQYALKGYEVQAFDYVLKPLSYKSFSVKFGRALKEIKSRGAGGRQIALQNKDGLHRVNISEIRYVEVMNHDLIYHLGRVGMPEKDSGKTDVSSVSFGIGRVSIPEKDFGKNSRAGERQLPFDSEKTLELRGTLKEAAAELKEFGFLQCSSSYLVNPEFISSVQGNELLVDGARLPISRGRKKEVLEKLADFIAGA